MSKRITIGILALSVMSLIALGGRGVALAGDKTCPLQIKGMQCAMCAGAIEAALKAVPGVKSAKVDYSSARADVVVDDTVQPATLLGAVKKAGFEAVPLPAMPQAQAKDSCCKR
ncbi:MAG TPA: heavy metal-associated domain-containing protein [Candidatus Binataceae bacterium]|nr:heavy metal-associated domain-containing protein [Candidatus Binataceae bacterium]